MERDEGRRKMKVEGKQMLEWMYSESNIFITKDARGILVKNSFLTEIAFQVFTSD